LVNYSNISKKVCKKISKIFKVQTRKLFVEFRRKLYTRGSSYETTIPKPLLFQLDLSKKNEIVFKLDQKTGKWYVEMEETK
jgi:hypothetical protein